ncbi:MAG TPA: transglycosylase SLT domain-containing protein [Rhodothermales bacterium]|nr:transglycosylase SLT domain-containing protein [Rhodothermales bacterium]
MPRGDESRRIARRHIQKLLEYRPAIVEAAKDYEIGSFAQFYTQKRVTLAPWVLAGIISRETNVANIEGDYIDPKRKLSPRGFGLCQITIPYHRAWVDKWLAGTLPGYEGKPRDPTANIRKGAEILSERIRYFRDKGPAKLSNGALLRAAVAAYNASLQRVAEVVRAGGDPDVCTTGKDYAEDVLTRGAVFKDNGFGPDETI